MTTPICRVCGVRAWNGDPPTLCDKHSDQDLRDECGRLRETLGRALDLCRSLLRFGPGGAAGAGLAENVQRLAEEAEGR